MGEPVVILGESLVEAVVEVLVVGEDDVTANVVQLERGNVSGGQFAPEESQRATYEALGSDVGAGKTASLVGRVDNQPRRAVLSSNC